MVDKDKFFKKHNIDKEKFEQLDITWEELMEIHDDYIKREDDLQANAYIISQYFNKARNVHSIRTRVKSPERLIRKIIRKKLKDPTREINVDNYMEEVTDTIGVRVLHLFKTDWRDIHNFIINKWNLKEEPKAYIREGDDISDYDTTVKCQIHEYGYRSIHYIIETTPHKKPLFCEIQVRTIFEEGWSEIDHKLRYPHDVDNPILKPYLMIFNGLSGLADQMGTYIGFLNNHLKEIEENAQKEMNKKNNQIEQLKNEIRESNLSAEEKQNILNKVDIIIKPDNALQGGLLEISDTTRNTVALLSKENSKNTVPTLSTKEMEESIKKLEENTKVKKL